MNKNKNLHFQSRWGFHPCDYSLFLKLKYLHKWYWQTLYDFHRWHRWWRKQEQNRRGSEPIYCPVFVKDEPWYKAVQFHGVDGVKVYPRTAVDFGIVSLYQTARSPQDAPVAPFDVATVEQIEDLHSKVSAFAGD